MSRYYDLVCRDCGEPWGFEINHGAEILIELWHERDAMLAADRFSVCDSGFNFFCYASSEIPDNLSDFIERHHDHDVRPRDEYGQWWDSCGTPIACPCCGRRLFCALLDGHDGDCKA